MTWSRRALVLLGVVIVVIAFRGVLDAFGGAELWRYFRFLIVGWLANDLVVLPLVICLGWLVSGRLPAGVKPVVQAALLISLTVTIVAFPLVTGVGRGADNPSALPRDYGLGLAITLGVVWLAAALLLGWRHLRGRGVAPSSPGPLDRSPANGEQSLTDRSRRADRRSSHNQDH